MEQRAASLGLGGQLRYIFPDNSGLRGADVAKAKALGIDAQIAADVHVGAGGGVDAALKTFEAHADFQQSAVNQETNAGTHTQERALQEAADLNAFFNANATLQRRILGRTASFCFSRSGHFDAFDQGLANFLPNMTWLQPPGHVHAMIHETWQPNALGLAVGDGGATAALPGTITSASAQRSDDGRTVVVRVVNQFAAPIGPNGTVSLALNVSLGGRTSCATCAVSTLSADDTAAANPSWAPDLVAPVAGACTVAGGNRALVALLPFSFTVLTFGGCRTAH